MVVRCIASLDHMEGMSVRVNWVVTTDGASDVSKNQIVVFVSLGKEK